MYVSVSRLFAWWLKGEELGQEERLPAPSARLILIDWDKYVGMVTSSNCAMGFWSVYKSKAAEMKSLKPRLCQKLRKSYISLILNAVEFLLERNDVLAV